MTQIQEPNTSPSTTVTGETWLKAHERLVIVALIVLSTVFLGHRTINYLADRAQTRATIAESALQQAKDQQTSQQAQDQKDAAVTAQVVAQYQAMISALSSQNADLQNVIKRSQSDLQTQRGIDASLPVNGLAQRIAAQTSAPAGSVSATETQVLLNKDAAVAAVQALDEIPALQIQLQAETQIADGEDKALTQANGVISAQATQITDLKTTVADDKVVLAKQIDADKKELSVVKAQARKSKIKLFLFGVGAGFGGAVALLAHGI